MKQKVLIVDDQFGIRTLLNEVLQKEGYEIYQAANGLQALQIMQKHSPDLVLLDMKIPGMDGLEILEKLKEIDSGVCVLIMTAYGEQEMIEKTKKLGAIAHFSKPFDINEVRTAVRENLNASDRKSNSP